MIYQCQITPYFSISLNFQEKSAQLISQHQILNNAFSTQNNQMSKLAINQDIQINKMDVINANNIFDSLEQSPEKQTMTNILRREKDSYKLKDNSKLPLISQILQRNNSEKQFYHQSAPKNKNQMLTPTRKRRKDFNNLIVVNSSSLFVKQLRSECKSEDRQKSLIVFVFQIIIHYQNSEEEERRVCTMQQKIILIKNIKFCKLIVIQFYLLEKFNSHLNQSQNYYNSEKLKSKEREGSKLNTPKYKNVSSKKHLQNLIMNNDTLIVEHSPSMPLPQLPPLLKMSAQNISAKSWIVYDAKDRRVVFGKKINKKLEVASLTKIMNFYVCLKTLQRYSLNPKKLLLKVSKQASNVIGTSANLLSGDTLNIYDLFYGLMLPSGNDVAVVLAQGIGTLLLYEKNQVKNKICESTMLDIEYLSAEGEYYNETQKQHENPIDIFLQEMNYYSTVLDLKNTKFDNPHGLANKLNFSTALDVARLSRECCDKFSTFQDVVNCKEYQAKSITCEGGSRNYKWRNTNKLLEKGLCGIKTGITETAGPCLAAAYKLLEPDCLIKFDLIIVMLNCISMEHRWEECLKLIELALQKMKS